MLQAILSSQCPPSDGISRVAHFLVEVDVELLQACGEKRCRRGVSSWVGRSHLARDTSVADASSIWACQVPRGKLTALLSLTIPDVLGHNLGVWLRK